jgi:hypothetical protein
MGLVVEFHTAGRPAIEYISGTWFYVGWRDSTWFHICYISPGRIGNEWEEAWQFTLFDKRIIGGKSNVAPVEQEVLDEIEAAEWTIEEWELP